MRWLIPDRLASKCEYHLLLFGGLALLVMLAGCGKDPQVDATSELAESFEGSPAKEDVMAAKAAFEEGRYKDSLYLLHQVVSSGDLSERQTKAMGGIVGQVMQAVHNDPELNTDPKLHRLMELLILQTMGET